MISSMRWRPACADWLTWVRGQSSLGLAPCGARVAEMIPEPTLSIQGVLSHHRGVQLPCGVA
ncbi:protein of unknown function [Acidithiobacillus ferrivorans]|uniref:Uncharacterized protein n=1 Tax=Acidithiobacillus ferrivorans TaxID=160808 RepID=A0A060URX0_9PROT|nr:hypothetical protein AFERRI_530267 [Acidithiobacillus ferrivorans]SMH67731.1 protein of unknown function [Acidithiobacillus ferrivorans]